MKKSACLKLAFLLLAMTVLTISCATNKRPKLTLEQIASDAAKLNAQDQATTETMLDTLADRAVARKDLTLDLLFLSGGGQNGAYGVGFLRGWHERKTDSMPKFDLVTGVSTGALQAPYALLGTDEAINQIDDLYRKAANEFAPKFDWLFWLRTTGGMLTVKKFREEIAREFNAGLRTKLSTEFKNGRQLAIGTADFDIGAGRVWNFNQELGSTSEALTRAQNIIYASAAIPGYFPPQMIDNHLHTDGGFVTNLLTIFTYNDYVRLSEKIRARGIKKDVTIRIWAIVNFWTHPRLVVADPSNRSELEWRGRVFATDLSAAQELQHLYGLSQAISKAVPGLKMQVHATSIPVNLSNEPGAKEFFNHDWMNRLEKLGYERALGDKAWDPTDIGAFRRPFQ